MPRIENKLEKLNTKNYTTWSLVLTNILKAEGLFDCVVRKLETGEEEAMKKNKKAKQTMYLLMDNQQIEATGLNDTAQELWGKIKENQFRWEKKPN